MKKYFVLLISLILGIVIVSGCSSSKQSEDTQKVIDKIVEKQNKIANSDDDNEKKYNYTEDDFSFLIYYDKDQKLYLVDSWVPFENKANDLRKKWGISLDENELKKINYDSDFNDFKKTGDYEVVYKSGKFEG